MARSPGLTVAESGGEIVGALDVSENSPSYAPVTDQRNLYVHLLLSSRSFSGLESEPHFWIKLVATVAPEAFASYELIAGQGGNNSSFGTTNQRDSLPLRTHDRDGWPGQLLVQRID